MGTYTSLYRWNLELQTNFTAADNTDYSMELSRLPKVLDGADPAIELSESYYMTKENRTFNIYMNDINDCVVLRFRGANSTNVGSITYR